MYSNNGYYGSLGSQGYDLNTPPRHQIGMSSYHNSYSDMLNNLQSSHHVMYASRMTEPQPAHHHTQPPPIRSYITFNSQSDSRQYRSSQTTSPTTSGSRSTPNYTTYKPSSSKPNNGPLENLVNSNKQKESSSSHSRSSSQPRSQSSSSSSTSKTNQDVSSLRKELNRKKETLKNETSRLNNIIREKKSLLDKLKMVELREIDAKKSVSTLEDEVKSLEKQVNAKATTFQSSAPIASVSSSTLSQDKIVSTALVRAQAAAASINNLMNSPGVSLTIASPAVLGSPWSLKFTGLDLKYKVERDIMASSTFIVRHGYRMQFRISSKVGGRKVLLRLCNLDKKRSLQLDYIHHKLNVTVNGRSPQALPQMQQQRKYPFRGPVDITDLCSETENNLLMIAVENSLPQGASSEAMPEECGISLIHVSKNEFHRSIDMLTHLVKYTRSADETKSLIKKQFSSDDSCGVTDVNIPLTCPYSKTRLKLPCFGTGCSHLTFFCGATYLELNERRDNWSCPVCRKTIGLDDIRVDGLLKQILKETKETVTLVRFDRHGNWKVVDDSPAAASVTPTVPKVEALSTQSSKPVVVENVGSPAVVIDLIDSDDETDPPVRPVSQPSVRSIPPIQAPSPPQNALPRVLLTPLPTSLPTSIPVVASRETTERESPAQEEPIRNEHVDSSDEEVIRPKRPARTTRSKITSGRATGRRRDYTSSEESSEEGETASSSSSTDSYSPSPSPLPKRKQPLRKRPGPMSRTAISSSKKKK